MSTALAPSSYLPGYLLFTSQHRHLIYYPPYSCLSFTAYIFICMPVYSLFLSCIYILHYCTTCLHYSLYILLFLTRLPQYYILLNIIVLYFTAALFYVCSDFVPLGWFFINIQWLSDQRIKNSTILIKHCNASYLTIFHILMDTLWSVP